MTDEALSALATRCEREMASLRSMADELGGSDDAILISAADALGIVLARAAKAEERVKELGGLLREMLNAMDAEATLVSRAERMADDQDAYSENELSAAKDAACDALVETMSVFARARAVLEKG